MSRLERQAEIIKLARLLRVEVESLEFLQTLETGAIRRFREQASGALFDADEARLKRVAKASKLLPTPLIALISEQVFGALLCARVAGLMAPERAAEVASRLRIGFLADVTLEIDPRHVEEVIARIPTTTIVAVALELAERGEFVTLARFVDFVGNAAIRAVMEKLTDNRALLHIAFFVENKARLNDLIGFLPEQRLKDIILVAANESENLWAEALTLMNLVNRQRRTQMGNLAASLDESVLLGMARAAQEQGLWAAVLPIIAVMDVSHQQRLANLPVLKESNVLNSVLDAVETDDLWAELLPLVPLMDEQGQQTLAELAERLGDESFSRVFECSRDSKLWKPVILLLLRMRQETHDRLRPLVSRLSPDSARGLLKQADELGMLDRLTQAWESLVGAKPQAPR